MVFSIYYTNLNYMYNNNLSCSLPLYPMQLQGHLSASALTAVTSITGYTEITCKGPTSLYTLRTLFSLASDRTRSTSPVDEK